jgi:DNA-binding response OmpR family regulator
MGRSDTRRLPFLFTALTLLPVLALGWLGAHTEVRRLRDRLARAELRRSGRPVPLTPLKFKLLRLFARRPGRVLTRRVIIGEAWGRDTAITERVVDNQIANPRRKIEPVPAEPRFLRSVRGIAYRFDVDEMTES